MAEKGWRAGRKVSAKGKRNGEWKNTLFLLWSKTLTKSRNTNWPGTPPAIMAVRRGLQLSSLTPSRCQDKSCFHSEFLYSHRDAGAALTHTLLSTTLEHGSPMLNAIPTPRAGAALLQENQRRSRRQRPSGGSQGTAGC